VSVIHVLMAGGMALGVLAVELIISLRIMAGKSEEGMPRLSARSRKYSQAKESSTPRGEPAAVPAWKGGDAAK
jgi:hypothetical protein